MIDKQKVIQLAISQKGYKEKASDAFLDDPDANAGSGNWTKYARDLDNIPGFYNGKKNGPWGEWCDIYIDWLFVRAYGAPIALGLLCQPVGSAGAGCQYSCQYYKNKGRFFQTPEVGDQIFFSYGSGISHTGLVIEVNQFAIITIEGNVNNQVQQCSYPHDSSVIYGYGRPCWELYTEEETTTPEPEKPKADKITVSLPEIKYGDTGLWVKVMQTILIGKGFSCGSYGADGDYGTQTKIALYEFQKARGITTNFICDAETWTNLLEN